MYILRYAYNLPEARTFDLGQPRLTLAGQRWILFADALNLFLQSMTHIFLTFGYPPNHTKHKEYVYSVAVYQISNEVGRIDNFRALARKLSFLPNEFDIFGIRQHYVRILFIFQLLICGVSLFLTPTNMNLAVYGNELGVVMTSWITLTAS